MWMGARGRMHVCTSAIGKDYRVVGCGEKEERLEEKKRKINQNLPDTKDPLIQLWPFLTQSDSITGLDDESRGAELPAGLQIFSLFVSQALIPICVTVGMWVLLPVQSYSKQFCPFWVYYLVFGRSCGSNQCKLCGNTILCWTSQVQSSQPRQRPDFVSSCEMANFQSTGNVDSSWKSDAFWLCGPLTGGGRRQHSDVAPSRSYKVNQTLQLFLITVKWQVTESLKTRPWPSGMSTVPSTGDRETHKHASTRLKTKKTSAQNSFHH